MKRRVCSYDRFAVPDPSFVLKDIVGEMYFCNLRCFCLWSVQLARRPEPNVRRLTFIASTRRDFSANWYGS
jgi:hypothetical protein